MRARNHSMSIAALAVCAAGCGRIRFDPIGAGGGDGGGDGALDAPACTSFGPWGAPQRITELATTAAEYGAQIQADGLTLYFDRHTSVPDEIFVARRPDRASAFGAAQALSTLGTSGSTGSATVSLDGLELYYETSRTGTICINRSTRADTASAWGAPAATALCGSATEGPFLTRDGLTLYYNSATPPTDYEGTIMVTKRGAPGAAFPVGAPIAELASGATKGYVALSGDELTLYFESGSPTDLYQATRPDLGSPFGAATPIPGINTASIEQDVSITTDGLELFFASNRPGSSDLDLYVATRSCI